MLRALSRTRKDLQQARIALVNQLSEQLARCHPGAVQLFAELHSAVAIAFLRRYPTSHATVGLTEATLTAFLRRIHYCGRKPARVLLARLHAAPQAGISATEAAGRAVCVAALVDAIELTSTRERDLEAEIVERLEVHADQATFTSLPRAGRGVRAAAAAGRARRRPRPLPRRRGPGRPGRRRASHQGVRQSPLGRVPLGLRQEAARRAHRLRR